MNVYPQPKCKGLHSDGSTLETILENDIYGAMGYEWRVVWCKCCGAVAVDKTLDGRLVGSIVPMKFPEITRQPIVVDEPKKETPKEWPAWHPLSAD